MDAAKKEARIKAAREIADQLLADGKRDENGLYWDFVSQTMDLQAVWGQSDNIYSGSAGVAWFLMEMKVRTGEDKYLEAAKEACQWMVQYRKGKTVSGAFITGSLGVAWAWLRLGEMTGEPQWRDHALNTVRELEAPALEDVTIDDLLNGISGTALALVMIHEKTGEDWILEKAAPFVEMTIRRAWMGPKGLYWDRNEKQIRGLCGITHGAAGLGHAFLELGYYFNNPAFYELTHQAFAYETALFDEEQGAWPDMRKGIFNESDLEEHIAKLKEGDIDFFTKAKYMDAWCHGAPGIGLTRIRAYEVLKDQEYLDHFRKAIKRVPNASKSKGNSFTLCHGLYGDLEVLLEGFRVLGEDELLDDSLVDKPIEFMKSGKTFYSGFMALDPPQEGKGMFMGNAGIGYSLLRWTDPKTTETMLVPKVEAPCTKNVDIPIFNINSAGIYRMLLEKQFARSLKMADKIIPQETEAFLNGLKRCPNVGDAFIAFLKEAASRIKGEQGDMFKEILQLEGRLFEIDQNCPSIAMVNSRQIYHGKEWAERGEEMKQDDLLVLDPDVEFIQTQWNWTMDPPEKEETQLLVKVLADQVMETTLNDFTFEILNCFKEPLKAQEAIERILSIFELEDPSEAEQVKQLTSQQIQEALKSGMLLYA